MNNTSYTVQILDAMVQGFIQDKLNKGWTKRRNGMLEDMAGQLYTVNFKQVGDENMRSVKFELERTSLVNF